MSMPTILPTRIEHKLRNHWRIENIQNISKKESQWTIGDRNEQQQKQFVWNR